MLRENYALSTLLIVWGCWQVSRMDVPILDVSIEEIRSLMTYRTCKFDIDISEEPVFNARQEIMIQRSSWSFISEKFHFLLYEMCNLEKLSTWMLSQLFTLHFFEEMVVCEKFLIAIIILAALNMIVCLLTSDPLVPSGLGKEANAKEMRYIPEKFIIMTSVIVRTPESGMREKHFSMTRLNGSATCILTDITVFALWYAILSSISVAVRRVTARLEEAVLPGRHCFNDWATGPYIKICFLLFAVFCTGVSIVSMTITSYRLVHPLYAAVMIVESVEVLLKSCYAVSLFLHSFLNREEKKSTEDRFMRFSSSVSKHLLSIIRYSLYIYIGGFVNNKIIPLCFLTPALFHLNGLLTTFTSSRFYVAQRRD